MKGSLTEKAPSREEGGRGAAGEGRRMVQAVYGEQAVTVTLSRNQPSSVTEQSVIDVKAM